MTNDREKRAARAEQMRKERDKAAKRQRSVITLAIVAVVIVLVGLGAYGVASISGNNVTEDRVIQPSGATEDFGVVYDAAAAGVELEPDAAPVEIEIYEDFLCPGCQAFDAVSGAFLREKVTTGEAALVFRPYSFLDARASRTEYSKRATNLSLCVLEEASMDQYIDLHGFLYLNQPEQGANHPTDSDLVGWAEDIGVEGDELDAVETCVTTQRFGPWVEEARSVATSEREVSGTPTIYIAGELSEARTPEELQAAIDAAAA